MLQAARSQTVVRLVVVACSPVVEVLIKRPDIKYQLGFSVQNGVVSFQAATIFLKLFLFQNVKNCV